MQQTIKQRHVQELKQLRAQPSRKQKHSARTQPSTHTQTVGTQTHGQYVPLSKYTNLKTRFQQKLDRVRPTVEALVQENKRQKEELDSAELAKKSSQQDEKKKQLAEHEEAARKLTAARRCISRLQATNRLHERDEAELQVQIDDLEEQLATAHEAIRQSEKEIELLKATDVILPTPADSFADVSAESVDDLAFAQLVSARAGEGLALIRHLQQEARLSEQRKSDQASSSSTGQARPASPEHPSQDAGPTLEHTPDRAVAVSQGVGVPPLSLQTTQTQTDAQDQDQDQAVSKLRSEYNTALQMSHTMQDTIDALEEDVRRSKEEKKKTCDALQVERDRLEYLLERERVWRANRPATNTGAQTIITLTEQQTLYTITRNQDTHAHKQSQTSPVPITLAPPAHIPLHLQVLATPNAPPADSTPKTQHAPPAVTTSHADLASHSQTAPPAHVSPQISHAPPADTAPPAQTAHTSPTSRPSTPTNQNILPLHAYSPDHVLQEPDLLPEVHLLQRQSTHTPLDEPPAPKRRKTTRRVRPSATVSVPSSTSGAPQPDSDPVVPPSTHPAGPPSPPPTTPTSSKPKRSRREQASGSQAAQAGAAEGELVHPATPHSRAAQPVDCPYCEQRGVQEHFPSTRACDDHIAVEHRGVSWKCPVDGCDQSAHHLRDIQRHQRNHAKSGTLVCTQCNKSFDSERGLREHAQFHDKGGFTCDVCGKVFQLKASRQKHSIKRHGGYRHK